MEEAHTYTIIMSETPYNFLLSHKDIHTKAFTLITFSWILYVDKWLLPIYSLVCGDLYTDNWKLVLDLVNFKLTGFLKIYICRY